MKLANRTPNVARSTLFFAHYTLTMQQNASSPTNLGTDLLLMVLLLVSKFEVNVVASNSHYIHQQQMHAAANGSDDKFRPYSNNDLCFKSVNKTSCRDTFFYETRINTSTVPCVL
jgi:hypothetical protein